VGIFFRYSFIHFKSAEECKKGHDAAQGKVVRSLPIMVQYAKKSKASPKKQKKEKKTEGM